MGCLITPIRYYYLRAPPNVVSYPTKLPFLTPKHINSTWSTLSSMALCFPYKSDIQPSLILPALVDNHPAQLAIADVQSP